MQETFYFWGVFPIFCDFRHVLMKRCSSVNPDRVSNPVRVVLPRLHERLQTIGNAPYFCNSSPQRTRRKQIQCVPA
ncbi:hypothetical protein KsCSTR_31530 [Candidatus Kuenenia stuttgartiensis]|uniref:Uncharacterized protein n=1 Tax=Kuenenia stuttgartiensis TaxID=174633 RepID=Q1Q4X8_KUEST|nr:hypothetical protein KsCSTR_31530 [Candidatus Kuenenia stuttgartiensis]CAJ75070.1 unknown protein [Candidatus Kuenenia stuttgartiensis]